MCDDVHGEGQMLRAGSGLSDELIYNVCVCHYIVNLTKQRQNMLKSVFMLLLLLVATSAYYDNCRDCKPATKVASCPDYHCYRCGRNEVLDLYTLQCQCIENYYRVNGVCGQCPEGYSYDPITQWCTGDTPCGVNQVLVNGVCQCQPGLVVIQNICQGCPVNQTYFPDYDACRCSPGYSLINGSCILVECGYREVYSEEQQGCVCEFGYYKLAGVCGRCKNDEVYNSITQTCNKIQVPKCGWNEYFWECCCFCQNGYVRIGGRCVTCPEHSSYSWTLNACICNPGFYFVGEQIKRLPPSYYDTGSSVISNPAFIYMSYGPTWGPEAHATLLKHSNYDYSGINTNGVNINNVNDPERLTRP